MIYGSSSVVINSGVSHLWHVMEKFLAEPLQGQYIKNCTVQERYYDGFTRNTYISGQEHIKERVFCIKEQNKIITRLEDHPLLIGDTIYHIISPDNPNLSERKVTLCIVIAWRMRPGIIEAPVLNKQVIAEDLVATIKAVAEHGALV